MRRESENMIAMDPKKNSAPKKVGCQKGLVKLTQLVRIEA